MAFPSLYIAEIYSGGGIHSGGDSLPPLGTGTGPGLAVPPPGQIVANQVLQIFDGRFGRVDYPISKQFQPLTDWLALIPDAPCRISFGWSPRPLSTGILVDSRIYVRPEGPFMAVIGVQIA